MTAPKCPVCGIEMVPLEGVGHVCVTEHCPALDGVPKEKPGSVARQLSGPSGRRK